MNRSILFPSVAAFAIATFALLSLPAETPATAATEVVPAHQVTATAYPETPLFGDTHLHTTNSFDAFGAGNRLTPDDALRFARGNAVTTASGMNAKLASARVTFFVQIAAKPVGKSICAMPIAVD